MKLHIFIGFLVLALVCEPAFSGAASKAADIAEDIITSEPVRETVESITKSIRRAFSGVSVKTKAGSFVFKNTQQVGRFGDMLTAKRMTAMGYTKLISKRNEIHGIDGVYVKKWPNGEMKSVRVIENKVNSSKYGEHQMSDQGIIERAKQLVLTNYPERVATGNMLLDVFHNKTHLIEKELWRHDLNKGTTKVFSIAADGTIAKANNVWKSEMIDRELIDLCKRGKIKCDL